MGGGNGGSERTEPSGASKWDGPAVSCSAGIIPGGKGGPLAGNGSNIFWHVSGGGSMQTECTKEAVLHALDTVVHEALHCALQRRGVQFLLPGLRAGGGVLLRWAIRDGGPLATGVTDTPVRICGPRGCSCIPSLVALGLVPECRAVGASVVVAPCR